MFQKVFEANVFRLLVKKELIGKDLITKMRSWKHTGFQVYTGPKITDKQDILRVGLYIVRPPVSASRLQVDQQNGALKYLAKGAIPNDRCDSLFEASGQLFDPIDWIAKVTSHIPEEEHRLYATAEPTQIRTEASFENRQPPRTPLILQPFLLHNRKASGSCRGVLIGWL